MKDNGGGLSRVKQTDLLTIVIPCYERIEYLSEAIESAISQTVKPKVVVLDNASKNIEVELCQKNIQKLLTLRMRKFRIVW